MKFLPTRPMLDQAIKRVVIDLCRSTSDVVSAATNDNKRIELEVWYHLHDPGNSVVHIIVRQR